jgi:SAM-dependent methyltransferase
VFPGKANRGAGCPEVAFGGFSAGDGKVAFFTRVHALLDPSFVVLDAGCGRGIHAEDPVAFRRGLVNFRGKCKRVIGIDVDPPRTANPLIDEFRRNHHDRWPLEDGSIDLCVSQNVLEHVPRPELFFSECARVLKENGVLCIKTPNSLGYPALAARLVPNRWHASVLRMIGVNVDSEDVFPTLYRCNTARKMRSMMGRHGFEACAYTHGGDPPGYLRFSRIAFGMGRAFHRFAPRAFMPVLFAFGREAASKASSLEEPNRLQEASSGAWKNSRAEPYGKAA